MKKRTCIIMMLCVLLMSVMGCGAEDAFVEDTVKPDMTAPPDEMITAKPAQTLPAVSPQIAVNPPRAEGTSYTTGLPWEGVYNPVVVMVENAIDARPQTGVGSADIVYETTVEGLITRFMLIFSDTYPEVVGPVRSIRLYHVDIAREYDPVLIHYGGAYETVADVRPKLEQTGFSLRVDGMTSSLFWRDSTRSAPHNAYIDVQTLMDDSRPDQQAEPPNLSFNAQSQQLGSPVTTIEIPYTSSNQVRYEYDAQTGAYQRFIGNKAFMDRESGQVCVTNIIVQYARHESLGTKSGHIMIHLDGQGDAVFFMGGKMIKGTWIRDANTGKTTFLTTDNEVVELMPGNTWIQVVPLDVKVNAIQ